MSPSSVERLGIIARRVSQPSRVAQPTPLGSKRNVVCRYCAEKRVRASDPKRRPEAAFGLGPGHGRMRELYLFRRLNGDMRSEDGKPCV